MALTEQQFKKQWFWTNGCFRRALLEHYSSILTEREKRSNLPQLKKILVDRELSVHSEEINQLYINNITAMSTKRLEIVLKAAKESRRKQETIDAITTELFERSVNPETREKHE